MVDSKLKSYIHLVNFIADFLGPSYEVVLHDVRNINNSIIAIKNGHISGICFYMEKQRMEDSLKLLHTS
jgi:predicted transcriptional regulator YheO